MWRMVHLNQMGNMIMTHFQVGWLVCCPTCSLARTLCLYREQGYYQNVCKNILSIIFIFDHTSRQCCHYMCLVAIAVVYLWIQRTVFHWDHSKCWIVRMSGNIENFIRGMKKCWKISGIVWGKWKSNSNFSVWKFFQGKN